MIVTVLKQVVNGIKHMHEQSPPIAHRDIKVENILIKNDKIKLCDFGSASDEQLDPRSVSSDELEDAFERYEKYTTFMYRPPEMQDKFSNYRIDLKVDSWMLGCVLFALWFYKHPFQDAQKLAIINAHFFIPTDRESQSRISEKMRDLIWHILTPNPAKRPSIHEIEKILANYERIDKMPMNSDAKHNKNEYFRKLHGKSQASKPSQRGGDMTPDDIAKLQSKIKREQENKRKQVVVQFHDDYNQKMDEQLYNKNPVRNVKHSAAKRSKVQIETKKSSSFEEEKKTNGSNFWNDFDDPPHQSKYNEVRKKTQSSKGNLDKDPFDWGFDQPAQSKTSIIYWIETHQKTSTKKQDSFDFDFGDNSKTQESENNWFDDFSVPKKKPKDSFDFDEQPLKTQKPKHNYFDQFKFEEDEPKQENDIFNSPQSKQVPEQSYDDDLIEIKTKPKPPKNPLFDDDESDEPESPPRKQSSNNDQDTFFGTSNEADTDHLFGFQEKDDSQDNYYGSIFEDNKQSNSKNEDILSKISSLYSESGIGSKAHEDILKPELPKVLQDHQRDQQKFIPEVQTSGQSFWENLYSTNEPSSAMSAPPSFPTSSYQPPTNPVPVYRQGQSSVDKSSWMPGLVKKQKKADKGQFKNLGIDYLLQTNVKK